MPVFTEAAALLCVSNSTLQSSTLQYEQEYMKVVVSLQFVTVLIKTVGIKLYNVMSS